MAEERVFRLRCAHQTFTWGKFGEDSLVAELLQNTDSSIKIEPETPYSELWMGTHCLGSSRIIRSDGSEDDLDRWITDNLGAVRLDDLRSSSLSFMFKVLSIRQTLSLQIHPDKEKAKLLHKQFPEVYKDPNDKPEMAIAINNFRALVGFKPVQTIVKHLSEIDELREIVGAGNAKKLANASLTDNSTEQSKALKSCFVEAFVRESINKFEALSRLIGRIKAKVRAGEDTASDEGPNLLKIAAEYPNDMGALAVYFLNEVTLQPGEALFVDVNEPHAYLEGDCLECLTNSHNVLRFGLTHKLKDLDNLVPMLKYRSTSTEDITVKHETYTENDCIYTHYLPPTTQFAVTRIQIQEGVKEVTPPPLNVASILLCLEGHARIDNSSLSRDIILERGTVVFVSAGEAITIIKQSETIDLFRAHAP